MTRYHALLLVSILLTVGVQSALKGIAMRHAGSILAGVADPRFYLILGLYGAALAAWFVAASRIQFTVLIPANILTVVLGGVVGYLYFGESMGSRKLLAYGLIVVGIVVLVSDEAGS
ncbi:hypothetical protein [Endothiovibrio diazotrophicus]